MTTPILRNNVGSLLSVTASNAVANLAYSVSADKLTIDNLTNGALLADFELTCTFSGAPVGGIVQLVAMDWSLGGSNPAAPAAPLSSVLGRFVGNFSPSPNTGNAVSTWVMRINAVALTGKTDFYIYSNGTAYQINSGWSLKAQCWTPGT